MSTDSLRCLLFEQTKSIRNDTSTGDEQFKTETLAQLRNQQTSSIHQHGVHGSWSLQLSEMWLQPASQSHLLENLMFISKLTAQIQINICGLLDMVDCLSRSRNPGRQRFSRIMHALTTECVPTQQSTTRMLSIVSLRIISRVYTIFFYSGRDNTFPTNKLKQYCSTSLACGSRTILNS